MLNVFKFKLDLKRQQSILINRTVNGDTAVQFQITVTDGGTPVTLDADLNKVLAIFRRSDNQVYVQDAETGLSFSGSVVTINVRPASFRAGRNSVELQIYTRPNSQATSWPDLVTTEQGLFNVRANTLTGDGPNAPSQLPMLEQLIHDAGVAVGNCNTATTAANAAAGSANAAATSANNAATAANNAAASANAAAAAVQPLYLNYSDGFSWNDLKEAWDDNRQVYLIETLNGYPNYKAMYRLSHLDYDGSTYYAGFIGSAFQTWRTKVMATCWGFTSNDPDEGMTES